jgi:serine/threonine protein kinase
MPSLRQRATGDRATGDRATGDRATGHRFAGYELQEFLGDGDQGAIYRARDARLGRQVALRVIAPQLTRDPVTRERLNREATALASVDHPNVAPIYDAGEVDGQLYVVTRWVDGLNLKELIARDGRLPPRRAVRIVSQVAGALQAAHNLGIVHRSVKPSSVLVTAEDHAYLTDFGLARHSGDPTGLTVEKHLLGDFDYVAPEYIQGNRVDERVDIYGLGCILYEALTGEVPYPRAGPAAKMYAHASAAPPSARERVPEVSEALDEVVRRAMAKRPEDRQSSVGEFAVEAAGAIDASAPPWARRGPHPAPAGSKLPQIPGRDLPRDPDRGLEDRGLDDGAVRSGAGAARERDGGAAPAGAAAGVDGAAAGVDGAAAGVDGAAAGVDGAAAGVDGAVSHDGFYEPVYYLRPRRSLRRGLLWGLAALVFLAAPIALLIALLS